MNDLKSADMHFAFGDNWAQYAENINEQHIAEAEKGLLRLLDREQLQGKTFLDIGCGSGLHSLAALRLGVSSVYATDIDTQSVATTRQILDKHALSRNYKVEEVSVFDLPTKNETKYDVVYSWGVLHHTGSMYEAITKASKMLAPGGLLVIAIYRKTPMCGIWRRIKRWYSHTSKNNQKRARAVYIALLRLKYILTRKDFEAMKRDYISSRGMSFEHDVHDWLGGYPYESITPEQAETFMSSLGFKLIKSNVHKSGFGFFGSGCDEYVFKKIDK